MNIFVYASLNAACVLCLCCVRVVRVVCGVLYVLCEYTHMYTSARTQTLINEHAHTLTHSHKQKHPLINMHTHTDAHLHADKNKLHTFTHSIFTNHILS